jgi:hypothetical protein
MSEPSDPIWADGPADQPADDDVFAELVSRFHDEPDARVWPDAEHVTRHGGAQDGAGEPDPPPRGRVDRDGVGGAHTLFVVGPPPEAAPPGTADAAAGADPDEADDYYIPPPPPRVPRPRPVTVLALGAIALGVVVLAVPALVARATSNTAQEILGVLLILGGVGLLVARMGDRPPTDDDNWPDDGAVV